MRAILIILIILCLGLLIPPYWFGMKAEDEFNTLVDNVSKLENLEIVSKSYKREWLTSSAEVIYSFKDEDKESLRIIEKDIIYHGPIPIGLLFKGKLMFKPVMAVIETKAELKTDSQEEYSQFINSLPQMDFDTTISLNGYGTTEVLIPSVDRELEDGKTLKWSGLDGIIDFTPELYKVSSVINSGNLVIEDDTFRIGIVGLDIESNLNYPASNYKNPLGNIDIRIEEFNSEGKDEDDLNKLTLTNLEFTGSTDQKGSLLNHTHSLGFEELIVGGNSYGPGIYELQLRNIDKTAFEEIQFALDQNQNLEGSNATDLLTAELMKALPNLFKSSPEIEVTELSIKTGQGEIIGHAIISVDGKDLDNPEMATNPIFLLTSVSAEINLSISQKLMNNLLKDYKIEEITDELKAKGEQLPSEEELQKLGAARAKSEIKDMLDQNILVINKGKYQMEANYGLGQVTLNGQPLNLGSLLGL